MRTLKISNLKKIIPIVEKLVDLVAGECRCWKSFKTDSFLNSAL